MTRNIGILTGGAIWGSVLALSCLTATNPREVSDPTILQEWNIAQNRLLAAGLAPGRAFGVPPEVFHWRAAEGPFRCNGQLSNGCYNSDRLLISWNRQVPEVIRHEAGHAILHVLGYDCWEQWEHPGGRCP